MQNTAIASNGPCEGFILLDSCLDPVLVNPAAAQILLYPQVPDTQKNLVDSLAAKVRSTLLPAQPPNGCTLVTRFQSGKRHYVCRAFRVDGMINGHSQPSFALLLERVSTKLPSHLQLLERFHLTTREQEVALFLLQGLTSKEIGTRMQISPNTVKAFLRLIMVKMGVSTRSGVVGKALTTEP